MAAPTNEKTPSSAYDQLIAAHYDKATYDVLFTLPNNDAKIPAHRKLLSILSTVFRAMFDGNWAEAQQSVHIKDSTYSRFSEFISYFYTNHVNIDKNNAVDLLYLAKKYDIEDVAVHCKAFMTQNMSAFHVLDWLDCSIKFDFVDLLNECQTFISNNTMLILESDAFLRCEPNVFGRILHLKVIQCTEGDMFDACIKWATARCKRKKIDTTKSANIRAELSGFIQLIRISEMDLAALAARRKVLEKLFSSDELCTIQWNAFQNVSKANRRQVKGVIGKPYNYSFPSNGLKAFHYDKNALKFSMSKTMLMTGIQLPGIFVETTSGGQVPLPISCDALFELRDVNALIPKSSLFTFTYGPSAHFSRDTPFIDLPSKEVITKNTVYEVIVTINRDHIKGHHFMGAFRACDRICRGIRFKTESGDAALFIGGLRFEEICPANLEHYIQTEDELSKWSLN